jgi:ParB family transcriptional regulator, chromosome partitioning protein
MMRKRGLAQGRGLDALLGSIKQVRAEVLETHSQTPDNVTLVELSLDRLQRGVYQPRREITAESLADLADSIKRHGVMQPIVVRRLENRVGVDAEYEIIAGERRWRAARLAGLASIPAIVRDLPDELAIALALIENIQREDLSPMEQAYALQRFHEEFGMSHQEIAETVGKARATVSNLLRLMSLNDDVKTMLDRGDLDMGHARALLAVTLSDQAHLARIVVGRDLSVRQTEKLIREHLNPPAVKPARTTLSDIGDLERRLAERLGARVELNHSPKGKGKLVIRYHSLDELDGILAVMNVDCD